MRLRVKALAIVATVSMVALGGVTGAAQAAGVQRYVSPTGTNNPTCAQAHPCQTITAGLAAASTGDTINVAAGTYTEQVVITKSVTIHGAGKNQTTIAAPASFVLDSHGETEIVQVTSAASVAIDKLTVAGPNAGADSCAPDTVTLDYGIFVVGGATLNLSNAAVNDIFEGTFNGPLSGCQLGGAIRYGSQFYGEAAHGTVNNVSISRYQKSGIVIDGTGTTATLTDDEVVNLPETIVASNGIQVSRNAVATITGATVSGNECNAAAPICGGDLFSSEAAGGGILGYEAGGLTVTSSTVKGNDIGILLDADVVGDQISNLSSTTNRYAGLAIYGGQNYTIHDNSFGKNGEYGVVFATDTAGVTNSHFHDNSAFNDPTKDMYADTNAAGNTLKSNGCATATPSRSYWGCN